ncbi:zinc-binding oxidoreductase ToxD [Artomyces pyxidatus]|uniref:Zinc-binding oxidoreductase ToxD n=1 Tax=Artomyces pyxidatus TaxID=48021 RepID=A0ACB8SMB7_9AGAM|nr:zinc-binding oxidoreductase ToxD [Artomyces pyxidatus]
MPMVGRQRIANAVAGGTLYMSPRSFLEQSQSLRLNGTVNLPSPHPNRIPLPHLPFSHNCNYSHHIMAPTTNKAISIQKDGSVTLIDKYPVPKPGSGQVLVKVAAAAQNPTDWKTAEFGKRAGAVSGCDFAGTVEEIGPDVEPGVRTIGERVAGFVHGGCYPNGSFAEYVVASAEVIVRVPDAWSFADAAQLGIAPFTALQTLYESHLDLPTPLEPTSTPFPILVSGGASSVGQYVVQFAKLAGLRVLATASKRNFELLKSLGADEVFDYNEPDVAQKIRAATGGQLKHAVDTISEGATPNLVAGALSEDGGVAAVILPVKESYPNVKAVHSLAYQLLGNDFDFPMKHTATPEHKQRGKKIAKLLEDILAQGQVKPNPVYLMPNGLASVPEGFQYMKDGKVSCTSLAIHY